MIVAVKFEKVVGISVERKTPSKSAGFHACFAGALA
jgi:hypothetical protein